MNDNHDEQKWLIALSAATAILARSGLHTDEAREVGDALVTKIVEKAPTVLEFEIPKLVGYVRVAAKNEYISRKRHEIVQREYRRTLRHLHRGTLDTAAYRELLLLFREWVEPTDIGKLERKLRRIFLESSSANDFSGRAGVDWRVGSRKYERLLESFADQHGMTVEFVRSYIKRARRRA